MSAGGNESPTGINAVSRLQSRLNKRMNQAIQRKRGDDSGADQQQQEQQQKQPAVSAAEAARNTWVEVQARARGISAKVFEELISQRRLQIESAMKLLMDDGVPKTVDEMRQAVTILQDAGDWFPGSSKELKVKATNFFF